MKKTIHHLVPISRCRSLGLNPSDGRNLIKINCQMHEAWHTLFGNMTPEEVVLFVIDFFFPDFSFYGRKVNNKLLLLLYRSRRERRK